MKCGTWLLLGGGLYLLYKARQRQRAEEERLVPTKTPVPPGTKPTGRTKRTTNATSPEAIAEQIAYAVRDWAEVVLPDGSVDWVEIDRQAGF